MLTPNPPGRAEEGGAFPDAWEIVAGRATRGPLAWIASNLEALSAREGDRLSAVSRKELAVSLSASRRLADMFESLIAIRRLTATRTPDGAVVVALAAVVEPVVRALEARAKDEGKAFTWTADAVGLAITADEDLVRRAFRLATGFVMDEAREGGTVRAQAAPVPGAVRIRITGSAPGEDAAPAPLTEPAEVAFVRLVIEALGGTMEATRSPEAGAVVVLVLPASPTRAASPAPRTYPAPPATDERPAAPALTGPAPVATEPAGGHLHLLLTPAARSYRHPERPAKPSPPPATDATPLPPSGIKIVRGSVSEMHWEG